MVIADFAPLPDDFPYLVTRDFKPSPSAELKKVGELQSREKREAEAILQKGKENFPFARCDICDQLAVIYYKTNAKMRL